MSLPPLSAIAQQLSMTEIEQLLELKRFNPKLAKLESRRQRLVSQLAVLDKQIAELTGEEVQTPKSRGSKPGRQPAPQPAAKKKPGRKPVAKTDSDKQSAKGKTNDNTRRKALLDRLAKARATLAAKREAAANEKAN